MSEHKEPFEEEEQTAMIWMDGTMGRAASSAHRCWTTWMDPIPAGRQNLYAFQRPMYCSFADDLHTRCPVPSLLLCSG